MDLAPTFVTHHEIESFLGGGQRGKRHRQRLQARQQLPEPVWLSRIDRLRVGVYPAFALAGLVNALAGAPEAKQRLRQLSAKVFGSAAFYDLNDALETCVREVLRTQQQWRFDSVIQRLGEIAEPAVVEWDTVVREAVEALTPWGISFSYELGCIERRSGRTYVVSLGNDRVERFSHERVAAPEMRKGCAVAVEHVRVLGDGLDVVLPALKTPETEPEAPDLWESVTHEDWDAVLTTASARAEDFSFAADYWRDEAPVVESSPTFRLPLNAVSGREAAAKLLAQRAQA
jgi:hypothetical protein